MVHIAGGGIIGCSIAWQLARRGVDVVLLEAGRLGAQSSRAGAGILSPGGEAGQGPWASRSISSLALYPGFVGDLEQASGCAIDYRVTGALDLAATPHELADIARKAAAQAALGIVSVALDAAETRALVPRLELPGLLGARHYPGDALVDPRDLMRALEAALRRRGVEIREQTAVTALPAGRVVLAAGAWSSGLLEGIPEAFPVKGYLAAYEAPPGVLGPALRHGHTYLLQRKSGVIIVGSTSDRAGFDTHVDPAAVCRLHDRAHRYLPSLLRASPDEAWTGLRPGVAGDTPQVGRLPGTDIWLAYGHYKKGILLAPITAQLIAEDLAPG